MHRRRGWILKLSGWLSLVIIGCAGPSSASPQQVFRDSFTAIRSRDASLEGVQLQILVDGDDRTGCGKAPDASVLAFYCREDRTIYTNSETLQTLNQKYGFGAVRYLAAHELAHGRQHAVTGFSRGLVWSSVVDELQADCIAGAYLRMTYGTSSGLAETPSILAFAEAIGDHSYFERDWHGTPGLRKKAVTRGLNQGDPARCLSSRRFNYGALIDQGRRLMPGLRRFLQKE